MAAATFFFGMLRAALFDRQKLMLENATLRQQIIVLRRSVTCVAATERGRQTGMINWAT